MTRDSSRWTFLAGPSPFWLQPRRVIRLQASRVELMNPPQMIPRLSLMTLNGASLEGLQRPVKCQGVGGRRRQSENVLAPPPQPRPRTRLPRTWRRVEKWNYGGGFPE